LDHLHRGARLGDELAPPLGYGSLLARELQPHSPRVRVEHALREHLARAPLRIPRRLLEASERALRIEELQVELADLLQGPAVEVPASELSPLVLEVLEIPGHLRPVAPGEELAVQHLEAMRDLDEGHRLPPPLRARRARRALQPEVRIAVDLERTE